MSMKVIRWYHGIERMDRMVMGCKGHDMGLELVVWQGLIKVGEREKERVKDKTIKMQRWCLTSYVVEDNILWMDLQYNRPCNNRLGYDCSLYIWRFDHKYLGKDRYTFGLSKLCHKNIQNWQHIQDDSLEGFQYKMANKSKLLDYWLLCIVSWDRKVMVGKDWHILGQELNEKVYDYELCDLW
jgi:hypothetical protein